MVGGRSEEHRLHSETDVVKIKRGAIRQPMARATVVGQPPPPIRERGRGTASAGALFILP